MSAAAAGLARRAVDAFTDRNMLTCLAAYKEDYMQLKVARAQEDADTCWICHGDTLRERMGTVCAGCRCNTCVHVHCAARWFARQPSSFVCPTCVEPIDKRLAFLILCAAMRHRVDADGKAVELETVAERAADHLEALETSAFCTCT